MYTSKKPYHNLKARGVRWLRGQLLFFKQIYKRFSEFEKPYLDESYPEMHLSIPDPDWPVYEPPWIPGPWGPPIPDPPPPDIPPGDGPFPDDPPDDPTYNKLEGCLLMDLPSIMEPGEKADFFFSGGREIINGRTVSHECATLWADGPGRVLDDYVCGPYGRSTLEIYKDAQGGDIVNVYASGTFGSECSTSTWVIAVGCPEEGVSIEYTTLTMATGSTQTLRSSDDKEYKWEITTGKGELSRAQGKSVVIQAPDYNEGCDDATVLMMSNNDDEDICDSIVIAFNGVDCDPYGPAFYYHCNKFDENGCMTLYYNCDGTQICGVGAPCCAHSDGGSGCGDDFPGCESCDGCCTLIEGYNPCTELGWVDHRSAAAIAAGCCPEQVYY